MTPLIDEPNTDYAEKAWANRITVRLYDPPRDGKTPADGAGMPQTSAIVLRDRAAKIAQGFTTDVVGWDGDWPTLGEEPTRTDNTDYGGRLAGLKASVEAAEERVVVKRKQDRKRTVKR